MSITSRLKNNWIFALIIITASGCVPIASNYPRKQESFWLLFKGDTVKVTFLIGSSLNKMDNIIQWGSLKCVGYKNDKIKIHFRFFEDQTLIISHLADSVMIDYIGNYYKSVNPEGKVMKVQKISNDKLYGFLEQIDHPKGTISTFVGEFIAIHLSFSIEINHSETDQYKPEMLNDIIDSLDYSLK